MTDLTGAYYAATTRPAPRRVSGYEVDEACWPDIERLARAMGAPADIVAERFRGGDRAWVAWCFRTPDGRDFLAGYLWVSVGEHVDEPVQRLLRFAPDECYGWGAGVHEDHRRRGLFTALLETAGAAMRDEGCRVMWLGIEDRNAWSRKAADRAGFRRVLNVRVEAGEFTAWPDPDADLEHVTRAWRMLDLEPRRAC